MRLLSIALLVTAACAHAGQIDHLNLSWRGADDPKPSASVAQAFAAAPIAFGLRDVRPDPTAVGGYDDSSTVLRTGDNVAQFCSSKLGEMLAHAGARMNEPPQTILETELIEFHVVEGQVFSGVVRIRAIVRRAGGSDAAWSKMYEGSSKRWGKSHSPDNFNEALSNALAEATEHLVQDDEFAHALGGAPRPAGG